MHDVNDNIIAEVSWETYFYANKRQNIETHYLKAVLYLARDNTCPLLYHKILDVPSIVFVVLSAVLSEN